MSSETKHTPGPWEDAEYPVVFAPYPKDSAATVEVANCMLDRDIFDQWQANARLIAAAPELLAEAEANAAILAALALHLEGFVSAKVFADIRERIASTEAAIARATGQEG